MWRETGRLRKRDVVPGQSADERIDRTEYRGISLRRQRGTLHFVFKHDLSIWTVFYGRHSAPRGPLIAANYS